MSAADRPTGGRALSRPHAWSAALCLSLIAGLLFLPAVAADAAIGSADLSVSGSVSPDPATAGDAITLRFGVHNDGPDAAEDVTLVAELPDGLTVDPTSMSPGACVAAGATVTCPLGSMAAGPPNAQVTILVIARDVVDETSFDVPVSVSASTGDPDDTNNDLIVMSTVVPRPRSQSDVALTSVNNVPNPVTGGYDLGSTAAVTNLGPGNATGVTLTDTLAPGETFVTGGSDPSCIVASGVVTCALGGMSSGDVVTVLIITKTPHVSADTTIHDRFSVTSAEDVSHGNDTLDVATAVRAHRGDFVAGYVPPSRSTTWLTDATQWSNGDPVATTADTTVALIGIPGGGPGGPVVVSERPCGLPFSCMTLHRSNGPFSSAPHGTFGNLIAVSVPSGYGASNPITGIFLDNWSVLGTGWASFDVSYRPDGSGSPATLSSCGGWKSTGPPCVSSLGRSFSWWNRYSFGDLRSVVRFTAGGTFGRER